MLPVPVVVVTSPVQVVARGHIDRRRVAAWHGQLVNRRWRRGRTHLNGDRWHWRGGDGRGLGGGRGLCGIRDGDGRRGDPYQGPGQQEQRPDGHCTTEDEGTDPVPPGRATARNGRGRRGRRRSHGQAAAAAEAGRHRQRLRASRTRHQGRHARDCSRRPANTPAPSAGGGQISRHRLPWQAERFQSAVVVGRRWRHRGLRSGRPTAAPRCKRWGGFNAPAGVASTLAVLAAVACVIAGRGVLSSPLAPLQ
jgi:hypothetical protein